MLTKDELWEKASSNEPITMEDIGYPPWRRECDGFEYELGWFGRIAYKHKDGFRWANGTFLTRKELKKYNLI